MRIDSLKVVLLLPERFFAQTTNRNNNNHAWGQPKRLEHRALDSFFFFFSLFFLSLSFFYPSLVRETNNKRGKFSSILLLVQSSAPSSLFFLSPGGREEEKRRTNSEREREVLPWFVPIYPPVSLFSYFFLLFRSVGAQGQSFLPIPVFRLGFLCVQRGLCGRSFRRLLYTHTQTQTDRGAHLHLFYGVLFFSPVAFVVCVPKVDASPRMELAQLWAHQPGEAGPAKLLYFYLFIFFFSWLWFDFFFFFFFLLFFPSFDLPVAEIHRVFSISRDWSRGHWPIHRVDQ